MKTLIAIPCMDTVNVQFMRSLLMLDPAGHEICYEIRSGSLVYDSRNQLLETAKNCGAERILWFDSDMTFPPDTLRRLEEDIEAGCDIVSGLYFGRKPPSNPVIFSDCEMVKLADNQLLPLATRYLIYPKDSLFEVAAFGFGCVLMTMEAARKVVDDLGLYPFMPVGGFGEDLSFCLRARKAGLKLWCDSRVQCGHIGYKEYTAEDFAGGD